MPSRSVRNQRESARLGKPVYRRESSVGDDLKDIAAGIGKGIARTPENGGGMLGNAVDKLKTRKSRLDDALEDAGG